MVTKKFLAAVQHGCDWFADPLPTHIIRKYYAEPRLEILNTLYLRMLCFGEFLPLNLSCICGLKCWILVWLLMIGMLDCPSCSMGTLRGTLHSAAVCFSSGLGGTPPRSLIARAREAPARQPTRLQRRKRVPSGLCEHASRPSVTNLVASTMPGTVGADALWRHVRALYPAPARQNPASSPNPAWLHERMAAPPLRRTSTPSWASALLGKERRSAKVKAAVARRASPDRRAGAPPPRRSPGPSRVSVRDRGRRKKMTSGSAHQGDTRKAFKPNGNYKQS